MYPGSFHVDTLTALFLANNCHSTKILLHVLINLFLTSKRINQQVHFKKEYLLNQFTFY